MSVGPGAFGANEFGDAQAEPGILKIAFGERFDDAFADPGYLLPGNMRRDDGKFVAAVPEQQVHVGSGAFAQDIGDADQHLVATLMSVLVVVCLEVVDVQHDQEERIVLPVSPVGLFHDFLIEIAPVVQFGQVIAIG